MSILVHSNHVVNVSDHRVNIDDLNEDDINLVRTLKEANIKTFRIKRMLCSRINKRMSTQLVKNPISKLITRESNPHSGALEDCL